MSALEARRWPDFDTVYGLKSRKTVIINKKEAMWCLFKISALVLKMKLFIIHLQLYVAHILINKSASSTLFARTVHCSMNTIFVA